jgi:phenylalanyl-tRNA synthetase beta chain
MKVPLSWLREFVEFAAEPGRLAEDLTLAGLAVDSVDVHEGETVLDLDVTTNRVDCMNVYGVAREVAALYGLPLRAPETAFPETGPPAAEALEVSIESPDLCPRFAARVLDVRIAPSPSWLRERLERLGVRPINNVVDLTNYVMLELGQPSHAFDLARVPGAHLIARWARPGERLVTLDGTERALEPRHGVVACPDGPLALAGVMGGASSEVGEDTRLVALEAAYWEPLAIRRAARSLGLRTEASHRFERGADPQAPPRATARIAHLLDRLRAGHARPGLVDREGRALPRRRIAFRPARAEALLGAPVGAERSREVLTSLGFGLEGSPSAWDVEVPSWRGDVTREVDLVEEVGRHHGLGRIPSTVPPSRWPAGLSRAQSRERSLRAGLAAAGYTEAAGYPFIDPRRDLPGAGEALRLANPISEERSVLRRSLVVPGLLEALETNLRHGRRDVMLFEVGRVFAREGQGVREELRLGLLGAGAARPAHWAETARPVDFFDLKGVLEDLAGRLGLPPPAFSAADVPAHLHPGRAARVRLEGKDLGWLGTLHPDLASRWGFREDVMVAEVALAPVLCREGASARFRGLPRFPAVQRDLSVLCPQDRPASALVEAARAAAGDFLAEVGVLDRYAGPPVAADKVSLMLRLRVLDPDRTLTGEEVSSSVRAVASALRALGAEIRGE